MLSGSGLATPHVRAFASICFGAAAEPAGGGVTFSIWCSGSPQLFVTASTKLQIELLGPLWEM